MKWPLVSRYRLESAERETKYKAIGLERMDRELQRKHDEIMALTTAIEQLEQDYQAEVARVEQLRKEYAGDLQLERARYDEFVRDMMEKVIRPADVTIPNTRSYQWQQPARELPTVIQSAIEDISFGNLALEEQQEREAWKRLKDDGSNAAEVAALIRKGETPE